jgi:hypothetical protein
MPMCEAQKRVFTALYCIVFRPNADFRFSGLAYIHWIIESSIPMSSSKLSMASLICCEACPAC